MTSLWFYGLLLLVLGSCQHRAPSSTTFAAPLCLTEHKLASMGTVFELQLVHSCSYNPESDIRTVKQLLDEMETDLSLYQQDSEISKLNRQGARCTSSLHLLKLVTLAKVMTARTDGAFDITVLPVMRALEKSFNERKQAPSDLEHYRPLVDSTKVQINRNCIRFQEPGMAITLDGLAKGYAVDEAAKILSKNIRGYLLNFSGNMLWQGQKPEGPWKIAVWNPVKQEAIPLASSTQGAIASSGPDYVFYDTQKKWHHIIDPRSLRSPTIHAAVTVVGESAMLCDILSTTAMSLSAAQLQDWQKWRFPQSTFWLISTEGQASVFK